MSHLVDENLMAIAPLMAHRGADLDLIRDVGEHCKKRISQLLPKSKPEYGICHGDLHGGDVRYGENNIPVLIEKRRPSQHISNGNPSPRRCAVGTLYKSCALATKRWKLEYYFEEGTGRLFDRQNDPLEREDVYRNTDYQAIRDQLLHALLSWRGDIADLKTTIDGTTARPRPNARGYLIVAPRIAPHTLAMKGTDAEERLNEKAEHIDSATMMK